MGCQEESDWISRGLLAAARGFPVTVSRGGTLRPGLGPAGASSAVGNESGRPGFESGRPGGGNTGEWEWTLPEDAEGAQVEELGY